MSGLRLAVAVRNHREAKTLLCHGQRCGEAGFFFCFPFFSSKFRSRRLAQRRESHIMRL
ncbi:hypothetical protein JOD01_002009 [Brevibacillus fulvus]|uniref:Uncharacterized protein n=1 Tax=Brevibacillus fulvus TaxID=1125967 RepID=A0A938XZ83_9BACL|nr:hypothetical protein [Brevibacillus fulvus]